MEHQRVKLTQYEVTFLVVFFCIAFCIRVIHFIDILELVI